MAARVYTGVEDTRHLSIYLLRAMKNLLLNCPSFVPLTTADAVAVTTQLSPTGRRPLLLLYYGWCTKLGGLPSTMFGFQYQRGTFSAVPAAKLYIAGEMGRPYRPCGFKSGRDGCLPSLVTSFTHWNRVAFGGGEGHPLSGASTLNISTFGVVLN